MPMKLEKLQKKVKINDWIAAFFMITVLTWVVYGEFMRKNEKAKWKYFKSKNNCILTISNSNKNLAIWNCDGLIIHRDSEDDFMSYSQ